MCHPAILGRRLDRPVINLGFSGIGRMDDKERAKLLAELDPCIYVIDCLQNMGTAEVAKSTEPFVRTLRKAHKDTPIVLVEDHIFLRNITFLPIYEKSKAERRAVLRRSYENLVAAGVRNLLYVPGNNLLGNDGEGTVDGAHPSDLGFQRMANMLEPILRALI
jgi:lysophospholipase L1-like esterase